MGGPGAFARLGALPMARRLKQLGALAAIGVGAAGFYWLHLGSNVEWAQEAFQSYVSDLGPLGPAILVGTMANSLGATSAIRINGLVGFLLLAVVTSLSPSIRRPLTAPEASDR